MSKKIIFKPSISEEYLAGDIPVPAVKAMPEWFKKFKRYFGEENKLDFGSAGNINLTIKACHPATDAMSSGYMISLRNDLFVKKNERGRLTVSWPNGGDNFVSTHSDQQIPPEMIPIGCDPQVFKFDNVWSIILPRGYSALITHPLNRNDLPFISLAGVVDLDTYHDTVGLPFFFKEQAYGIIPAGTPIAQVFPFKRESWVSEISNYDAKFSNAQKSKIKSKIEKGYRLFNWKRKDFK